MSARLTIEKIKKLIDIRNINTNNIIICNNIENYKNQKTILNWSCEKQHTWNIGAGNILYNNVGCPHCKKISESGNKRIPLDIILEKYKTAHNNLYTYPYIETQYKNIHSKITCVCAIHGEFKKTGAQITCTTWGFCPECQTVARLKIAKDNFFNHCNKIHQNKYNYSLTDYTGISMTKAKIIIICPIHGQFKQNAGDHYKGHGCSKCVKGAVSYKALTWLDYVAKNENIIIEHAANGGEYQIPNTLYKVDGYCKTTNTCYEFHGDAYHGNPNRYAPNDKCNHFSKLTAKQLYDKTIIRENLIKTLGYNLIVMWESDWNALKIPNNSYTIDSFKTNKKLTEDISIYGIELLDAIFVNYMHVHNFKCLICQQSYKTSISRRKQLYRQFNTIGCPSCKQSKQL